MHDLRALDSSVGPIPQGGRVPRIWPDTWPDTWPRNLGQKLGPDTWARHSAMTKERAMSHSRAPDPARAGARALIINAPGGGTPPGAMRLRAPFGWARKHFAAR